MVVEGVEVEAGGEVEEEEVEVEVVEVGLAVVVFSVNTSILRLARGLTRNSFGCAGSDGV